MRRAQARLPILERRLHGAPTPRRYLEREIHAPVDLCDARGRLAPEAIGWSRRPMVRANLRGPWSRRKRWNFWSWIAPDFCFSVTVADLDLASFCGFFMIDFERGERLEATDWRRGGHAVLPEHVERSFAWHSPRADYELVDEGGDLAVRFRGRAGDTPVEADFRVYRPADHESLNVVVPWSPRRFQLNSKHNTLRCEGEVRAGDRRYAMRPDRCHAVQDWGRGVWPYRSCWNWGVATGEVDGRLVGVNVGDRWTPGTGANENGILLDGRLHKVMEDLAWSYDLERPEAPWRVRAVESGALDLRLHPFHVHRTDLDVGLLASGGVVAFGRWEGVVRCEGGELAVHDLLGWAEEFVHRW